MEENLQERTKRFAIEIVKLSKKLPKNNVAKVMGNQLLRSGTSVGANTRAAFRGRSKKEFKTKLGIVIEEADECIFWLELIYETDTYKNENVLKLKAEADELTSIFVAIAKKN